MSVIELPRVEVNGRTYVDKENFKKEAIRKLIDLQNNECDTQDEKDGIQYAIIVLQNM
jgi:hypothetical protein